MQNKNIRKLAKDKQVKLWKIADKLGITDGNFSRLLRHDLSEERVRQILDIINEISNNREHEEAI